MLGDSLLFSPDIARVSVQGGLLNSGWRSGVGPGRAIQLDFGPARITHVQCPVYTAVPGTPNPWGIWVGASNHQPLYISPGAVSPPIYADRLEYIWVRRDTDYSGAMEVDVSELVVGYFNNFDPPAAPYEASGAQNRRLWHRVLERLGRKK